ncbi:MAG: zinc ABC transporter substrate-binding protein [Deltaproteobacteria bacterium]|nr:MAG: zinc ABC transporter substrate-binding protein [Deltaproteobacteria bacterium]
MRRPQLVDCRRPVCLGLIALALVIPGARAAGAAELRVAATITDLGSLAEAVGGDEVSVTVFAKGPQDAHFIEPRPSFIRALHDADLFIQVGMDLEIGWAPVLLRSARNADVMPGARGHLDASVAIRPLEVPTGVVDRSMGDVHLFGNPHYLTDPVNGLRVARRIRDRLIELRPAGADGFRERYARFERELAAALLGDALLTRHAAETLVRHAEDGTLEAFLEAQGESDRLAGWLGAMRAHAGTEAVQDHKLWPYFARRFGLSLVATLEPRPGIAPTTRHLGAVVEQIRERGIPLILSSPYFDPRHARWVAERTGAHVVPMAPQVKAREGADDYRSTIDYNVREVLRGL